MSLLTVGFIVLPIIVFLVMKIFVRTAWGKAISSYLLIVSFLVACFCLFAAKKNEQLFLYFMLGYLLVGVAYVLLFNLVKKEIYVRKVLKGYAKILLILLPLSYVFAIILLFFG